MSEDDQEWTILANQLIEKPITVEQINLHRRAIEIFRKQIQRRRTFQTIGAIIVLINVYCVLGLVVY